LVRNSTCSGTRAARHRARSSNSSTRTLRARPGTPAQIVIVRVSRLDAARQDLWDPGQLVIDSYEPS
jgi:hypothetical protein